MIDKLRYWFGNLSGPKKMAATVVAIAAGVGAIVGAANGSIQLYENLTANSRAASHLVAVDVGFVSSSLASNPELDIKLRNTGGSKAFVTRADVRVTQIWSLTRPYVCPDCAAAYINPSHAYKVDLPITGAPYKVSESLSQGIEPGDVDRFLIDFVPENTDDAKDYVFLLTLTLVYDENEKRLSSEVLFATLAADEYSYRLSKKTVLVEGLHKSDVARIMSENYKKIEEVKKVNAVENDTLRKLVRTVPSD